MKVDERQALWQLCHELLDELEESGEPPPKSPPSRTKMTTTTLDQLQQQQQQQQRQQQQQQQQQQFAPSAAEARGASVAPAAQPASGQQQLKPLPSELQPQLLLQPQQQPQQLLSPQHEEETRLASATRATGDVQGLASPRATGDRLDLLIEVDALRSSAVAANALRSARLTVTLMSGPTTPPSVVLSRACDATGACDARTSATARSSRSSNVAGLTWSMAVARKLQISREQLHALERLVVHIYAPHSDAWVAMGAVDLAGLRLTRARASARAELRCALRSADGRWDAELALVISVAPVRPPREPCTAAARPRSHERLVGANSWTRFQEIIEAIIEEE